MFTKIDSILWTDSKYKKLSDDGKFLFIYVLTCPHRNILGFYFLPIPYGSFDLGWVSERFTKGLDELFEKGFVNYNYKTSMIFIKNFLKYNPLENPNQVKGAIKVLDSLPSGSVNVEFIELVKSINVTLSKPLLEPLVKGLYKRLPKQVDVYVDVEVDVKEEEEAKSGSSLKIDKDLKLIANEYERCGFGTINITTKELLEELIEEYSTEWIVQAFKVCVESNKRTLKYARGILNNWKTEGGMKLGGRDGTTGKTNNGEDEIDWAKRAGVKSY